MTTDALKVKMNGTDFPVIAVTNSFTCCPILVNQLELCFNQFEFTTVAFLPCSGSLSVNHDPVV